MNNVITDKVMTNVLREHRGSANAILDLTIFDVRRIVEDAIDETKRGIAKRIVETRGGMIEMLTDGGFIDEEENIEEVIFEALEKL